MRLPKNSWPDTASARGTLFFAQTMHQMLSATSYESFRALSLDGVSRIQEAMRVTIDVREGHIPRVALEPILDEVRWTLDNDPVLSSLFSAETPTIKREFETAKTPDITIYRRLRYIESKAMPVYKARLEEIISANFNVDGRRIAIRTACNYYCSHLLNLGYSRTYLLYVIDEIFFSKNITRTGLSLIRRFFKAVASIDRKFVAYVPLNPVLGRYARDMRLQVAKGTELPLYVQTAFQTSGHYNPKADFLTEPIDASDEFSTARTAIEILSTLKSMALMAAQGMDFAWVDRVYVRPSRSQHGRFVEDGGISHQRFGGPRQSGGRALKSAKNYTRLIVNKFDRQSTDRLMIAIDTAVASQDAPRMENRLTSHWSALEVFLTAPLPGNARISQYVDQLVPCICLRYARSMCVAIHDEMVVSYRRRYTDLLQCGVDQVFTDHHSALPAILLLQEKRDISDDIFRLANKSPLGMHRLWALWKAFETPLVAHNTIRSHEDRIKWQIHRIYRTRNGIVHNGYTPSYLDSLVLNIVEYFRMSVGTVIAKAENSTYRSEVDQIVADISLSYSSYLSRLERLKGEKQWSADTVMSVFGPLG